MSETAPLSPAAKVLRQPRVAATEAKRKLAVNEEADEMTDDDTDDDTEYDSLLDKTEEKKSAQSDSTRTHPLLPEDLIAQHRSLVLPQRLADHRLVRFIRRLEAGDRLTGSSALLVRLSSEAEVLLKEGVAEILCDDGLSARSLSAMSQRANLGLRDSGEAFSLFGLFTEPSSEDLW